ncbi:hypothetical protein [Staphylococcus kloosii]|jgi:hypothetical protein|uniref:hypothetical protein n=1 Tax=Staphylococcus kloosii TaxID=29384 RepID=UPI00189D92E7|nr:hypothetical protein [Staphylococcus kloosii]MBF7023701.1 hypothetical protein [Staphylococcus kloosii]
MKKFINKPTKQEKNTELDLFEKAGIESPSDVTKGAIEIQDLDEKQKEYHIMVNKVSGLGARQAEFMNYEVQQKQNNILIAQNDEIIKQNNEIINLLKTR